jgi:RHS repeat-associated protein
MKKTLPLLFLIFVAAHSWSQTTIFSESMGSPTGTAQIGQNAFQNEPALTFSAGDQANGAYVQNASQSNYAGASGAGNIYFTTTTVVYGFSIEGINASNYNSLSLKYYYRKELATVHATFSVAYWNGTAWVTLANTSSSLFNEAANAPLGWYLAKELALPVGAQINGLKLRFVKSGPNAIRIDDVKLTGNQLPPLVINTPVSNIATNAATLSGNVTATAGGNITANGTVYAVNAINAAPAMGGNGVTTLATVTPGSGTGVFSNNSGTVLSPNVQYSYNAYATKNGIVTGYGTVATFYTLAATPTAPTVGTETATSLNVAIGSDTNPAITGYAVYEITTGKYLQVDGSLGASAFYQTAAVWGNKTVTGLTAGTTYAFHVLALNGDGIVTSAGPSRVGTTLLIMPAFTEIAPICFGSEQLDLPATSLNGITGLWSPDLTNTVTTVYTFTPDAGQSASVATLTVIVNPEIEPTFVEVAPICAGEILAALPPTSIEGIQGTWFPELDNTITTTYTFTPLGGLCVTNTTLTITVDPLVTPTFDGVEAICVGGYLADLPTTSLEGITGTWTPGLDNAATTAYTFTPDTGQCAAHAELTIAVIPNVTPTFPDITTICSASNVDILPTISAEGITGAWKPDFDNTKTTTYTFYPEEGQCAVSANLTVTVIPSVTPTFVKVDPVCSGGVLGDLPATSTNGITGTWSPDLDNTVTTTYTFTPTEGQCALTAELTIVIDPNIPTFEPVAPICVGEYLTTLPTASTNHFTGIWSPELDNTRTTTYTFTPDSGQCASATTLTIVVNQLKPEFDDIASLCAGTLLEDLPTTSSNGVEGIWTTDGNGNYTFTASAGTCVSNTTLTVAAIQPVVPTFNEVEAIPVGGMLDDLPVMSTNSITGSWSPELDNTVTTTYTFTPDSGQCATDTTLTIEVRDESGESSLSSPLSPSESLTVSPGGSNEVGLTTGELTVSPSGAANYAIPIAVPPGINGVVPQISLNYNSQGSMGIAGYGWNIGGLSSITRIPSTKFHDDIIDPVDFDDNDRFALDGQRLMLKSGTYGAANSVYETENFSNTKITFTGTFFKVEYSDGSKAYYGNSPDSKIATLTYALTYWENPQAVRISYNYIQANNTAYINTIKYGSVGSSTPINEVQFEYKHRVREDDGYVGGLNIKNAKILGEIKVKGNNEGFRNYILLYDLVLNYQRLIKITEKNGDKSKSLNPTLFTYDNSLDSNTLTKSRKDDFIEGVGSDLLDASGFISESNDEIGFSAHINGDFDGDGDQDFIYRDKLYSHFSDDLSSPTITDISYPGITFPSPGTFNPEKSFTVKCLEETSGHFKLMNRDAWCFVQKSTWNANTATTLTYNIFSKDLVNNTIINEYSRQIVIPKESQYIDSFTGDFNGDGLTDRLVMRNISIPQPYNPNNPGPSHDRIATWQLYFVNLDRRVADPNIFFKNLGSMSIQGRAWNGTSNYSQGNHIYVADVNGDGKSDIIVFKGTDIIVYTLDNNENLVQLWVTPNILQSRKNATFNLREILYEVTRGGANYNTITGIYAYSPIVGDLNGDGKADIILPGLERSVLMSTGISFVSEGLPSNYPKIHDFTPLLPVDFDNDGILNLMKFTRNSDTSWTLRNFIRTSSGHWSENTNNLVIPSSKYPDLPYDYWSINPFMVKSSKLYPDKPQLITFEKFKTVLTGPSWDRRRKCAFSIGFYTNQRTLTTDKLITEITLGNGVKESLAYSPLINGNGIYTSASQIENYPNYDIQNAPLLKVVSAIEKKSSDAFKKQLYRYYGATSNIEGLGFYGFRSVLSTNWFENIDDAISVVTKYGTQYRGAPMESFSVLGIASPTTTLLPTDAYISRAMYSYNNNDADNPLLVNKVYRLRNTFTQYFDGLDHIITDIESIYDLYNLTQRKTTIHSNGVAESKSVLEEFGFDNLPPGSFYFIGRPKSRKVTTTISPIDDESVSEEEYLYSDNLLQEIKKRSTNSEETTGYITEKNEFDPYGNITKKTLSTLTLNDRSATFVYDSGTHRFVTKKTDVLGLSTEYTYNMSKGLVVTETLPSNVGFPQKASYVYDSWGKKTKTTNYLGTHTTYIATDAYVNDNGGVLKTTTVNDGSGNKLILDDLGRKIHEQTKDINGNWTCISTKYDIYDKPVIISQPYFANTNGLGNFQVWNEMKYDAYGRLVRSNALKSNASDGKETTYTYSELSVKENDGQKEKATNKNIFGNVVSLSETINEGVTHVDYTYFANGNLKTTTSSGGDTVIEQDGWGRKKKLTDPSAGEYRYGYTAFGDLTSEEVVGKGITNYTLDNYGRVKLKVVTGSGTDTTNSTTTYVYNELGMNARLLREIIFKDEAVSDNYTVTYKNNYDNYRRLIKTVETRTSTEVAKKFFEFQKEVFFDDFGRAEKERYLAKDLKPNINKTSDKWIKNTFKNGYNWQIFDQPNNTKLWQTNTVNAQGNILTAALGNGIIIANKFDEYGFPAQIKHDKATTNIMTLNTEFENIYGNLKKRTSSLISPWSEMLDYDAFDRVKKYSDFSGAPRTQSYNDNGTIASNIIGAYAYGDNEHPYRLSTVTPVDQSTDSQILNYYTPRTQIISYDVLNNPVSISEANHEKIDFEYNALGARSVMYYGGLQDAKTAREMRKFYSADGSMEIKRKTLNGNSSDFVTYIGGDGYTAPVILKSDGNTQSYFYLHRDYQGSVVSITSSSGAVIERRLFDVWGSLIKYKNGSNSAIPATTTGLFLDRGYTGHEHLLGVGLINMNGRIYDPKLHKFLQPDNNIQDPSNTQNYNRYGYCMNNPTKYTDPSGEYGEGEGVSGMQLAGSILAMFVSQGASYNSTLGNPNIVHSTVIAPSGSITNYSNNYIDTYNNSNLPTSASNNASVEDYAYINTDSETDYGGDSEGNLNYAMGNDSMSGGAGQGDPPAKKPSVGDMKKRAPDHPEYKAPKSGARKVNHPRGKGWIDRDGRVWIPDDHNGSHAPHWDVQPEKGPGYERKYPLPVIAPEKVATGVQTVAAGYIVYKIIIALLTWECLGCGVLVTP